MPQPLKSAVPIAPPLTPPTPSWKTELIQESEPAAPAAEPPKPDQETGGA